MSDELLDSDVSSGTTSLNDQDLNNLLSTAKWAQFLSILGFIGLGFMLIGAIFSLTAGSSFSRFGGPNMAVIGGTYLVMVAIYFFPIYYLYKFASNMKQGASTKSNPSISTAISYLKAHYKFIGIFTIVIISLYLLLFVFGAIIMGIR